MSLESLGILVLRDYLLDALKDANEWILQHCYYCKNCRACAINSRLKKREIETKLRAKTVT